MNGFNGAQAAITAGYASSNARQTAHRLLTNAYIQEALSKKREELQRQAASVGLSCKEWRALLFDALERAKAKGHASVEAHLLGLLGRHGGFFLRDNMQQTHDVQIILR